MDEGWFTETVEIDLGKEGGAVFSKRCPKCGRYFKGETVSMMFNAFLGHWKDARAKCSKCGEIEPVFLCWSAPEEKVDG